MSIANSILIRRTFTLFAYSIHDYIEIATSSITTHRPVVNSKTCLEPKSCHV